MGGLGNGRRGGRSPPLLIGALIACILVLGFNYWVSSSRNLELQAKLYELEGQVRRGAAERGAVEMKKKEFQEEIQRQKEQISRIENLYKKQQEGAMNSCTQEKALLQLNISSSTKTLVEQKVQLNQLNDDLEKVQKDHQSCLSGLNTLTKKQTYEMTQCNKQILDQREQCEEKVAAAKLEVQKKMEKLNPPASLQKASPIQKSGSSDKAGVAEQQEGLGKGGLDDTKTPLVSGPAPEPTRPKTIGAEQETSELLTNEITEHKDSGPSKPVPEVKPSAGVKQDQGSPAEGTVGEKKSQGTADQPQKKTEDKAVEIMDMHGEQTQQEEAGAEDILISQQKGEATPADLKLEEPEDYDADEQIVGGADLEKQNQLAEKDARELEEELADYNGDDDNEGEFEADKQAALAQN